MRYYTTRAFPTASRQYEAGDAIDPANITAAEWIKGTESGAVVPARWYGTAAELAARGIPGPGVQVYETDTKIARVGDGTTAVASLPQVGSATYVLSSAQKQTGRVGGSRVGWLGASVTNGSSSTNATSTAFKAMTPKIVGTTAVQAESPLGKSVNAGVAGERSDQILARLAALLPQVDVIVVGPDVGTNDASQSITLAAFQANIIAMKAAADAAGKPIMFCLTIPRGSSATAAQALLLSYNRWMRWWARASGVPLADTFTPLCVTTTGYLSGAYDSGDGTHPNDAGHLAIANAISPVLSTLCPALTPWPIVAAGDGLIADPLLASSSLSIYAGPFVSPSFSVITQSDWPAMLSVAGKRVTIDNSASGSSTNMTAGRSITTGFSVGDVLLIVMQLRDPDGISIPKVQVQDQSDAVKSVLFQNQPSATPGPFGYFYTVGAGVTTVKTAFVFNVGANTTRRLDIGGINIYNLTVDGTNSLFGF
jgi:lysophospholipase L1-like esterase